MKSKTIQPVAMVLGTLFMALHPALASLPSDPAVSEERYPGQYHHVDSGGAIEDFIYLNGQKIGTLKEGTDLFFTISDHLGSSAVITNATGTVAEYRDYKPYGPQAAGQVPVNTGNDYLFTGKEQDPETSLHYFGARYYNNNQARFISTDPLLLNLHDDERVKQMANQGLSTFLTDPQQLNSYSYARNNPIAYSDPTGEVSLRALVFHPIETLAQMGIWKAGAEQYLKSQGDVISARFLEHSLKLNPGALNITEKNDDIGLIEAIRGSDEYQSRLADALGEYDARGQTTVNNLKFDIKFTDGDLQTSLQKAKFFLSGQKNEGMWDLSVWVYDDYDFKPENYEDNPFLKSANNAAYLSQLKGVISKYKIRIDFNDRIEL